MAAASGGYPSSVQKYVVTFINEEFGSDPKSLSKAKPLFEELVKTKESLEKQLSLVSTEVPSKIETAIHDAESAEKKIKKLAESQEATHHKVMDHVRNQEEMVKQLSKLTHQVQELEQYSKYLTCVAKIEELSSEIQAALITESMERSVEAFQTLTQVFSQLHNSKCANLLAFIKNTALFWYNILQEKIATEFEEILKTMKWPLVASTIKAPSVQNVKEVTQRMESLFKQLLLLQLPEGLTEPTEKQSATLCKIPGLPAQLLPLKLMFKPLRKRFKYHFHGKRQTNNIEKPEWYFTQALSWIRDHSDFLDKRVQPVLTDAGWGSVDARVELMRAMVCLVMEKMASDLPEVQYDDQLFAHLVDEALLFDRELRNSFGYPSSQPGCLHILTDDSTFNKWIIIERKFAVEKIDMMLTTSSAWRSQYKDISDVDELKVPECAESFMTLMMTITDRYKPLPHPSHKLRFLDLQLELLDDFRIRLVQVMKEESHNPQSGRFCSILNTAYYVAEVLREWSELVFFLQLQYYKQEYTNLSKSLSNASSPPSVPQSPGELASADIDTSLTTRQMLDSATFDDLDENMLLVMEGTVFDDIIDLFERMKTEMMKNLVHHVFLDVRARSQPYRKDKWLSISSHKDFLPQGLSSSACEMLLVLKEHLHDVESLISKPLFSQFWQRLADKLNKFIFEEVVLSNNFSESGSAQLQFDMFRNLFPLFGEYTQKPENYFRDTKEACTLLNLKVGSALLLKELLHNALHNPSKDPNASIPDPKAALHDMGVFKLSPEQTEHVLNLRTNLTSR